MSSGNVEIEQRVRDALKSAEIHAHEHEITALIEQHSALQASIERLYQVPVKPEVDLPVIFSAGAD